MPKEIFIIARMEDLLGMPNAQQKAGQVAYDPDSGAESEWLMMNDYELARRITFFASLSPHRHVSQSITARRGAAVSFIFDKNHHNSIEISRPRALVYKLHLENSLRQRSVNDVRGKRSKNRTRKRII